MATKPQRKPGPPTWVLAAFLGLRLLGLSLEGAAQNSPPGTPAAGGSPPQNTTQGAFGGPPVGQQQQQDLQQRSQQLEQASEPSSAQPAPAGRSTGTRPAAPVGAGPIGAGSGALGEPRGATTPRATVGGTLRNANLSGPATGAARTAAVAPARLSLPDAVALGLADNLTTLLATERAEETRALRQQVRSFLRPNLSGTAYQQNRTLNLAS